MAKKKSTKKATKKSTAKRKSGSGIHIKPENEGKYTKHSGGKVTDSKIQSDLSSPNANVRQMANFARMARRGWKPLGKKSSKKKGKKK